MGGVISVLRIFSKRGPLKTKPKVQSWLPLSLVTWERRRVASEKSLRCTRSASRSPPPTWRRLRTPRPPWWTRPRRRSCPSRGPCACPPRGCVSPPVRLPAERVPRPGILHDEDPQASDQHPEPHLPPQGDHTGIHRARSGHRSDSVHRRRELVHQYY